jgi:transposase
MPALSRHARDDKDSALRLLLKFGTESRRSSQHWWALARSVVVRSQRPQALLRYSPTWRNAGEGHARQGKLDEARDLLAPVYSWFIDSLDTRGPKKSKLCSTGETLHTLARRHDISRNLVRLWVLKFEAGAFDDDARAADLLQDYEAKIAALERMVGRQALEIEFLKGALKSAPRPRSASTSVISGPVASPSPKDAG